MAISKIASAGVATDTLTAADLAPDSVGASEIAASAVGISELNATTGITSEYHKVPVYANNAARDSAIGSPVNGMIIYNTTANALQQYNGAWAAIVPPPSITSISGFLNEDTDSTITVFGTNFNSASTVKMFTASAGGTQIGSNATTTFNSTAKLTAVFGAGSIGAAGSTAYIEVDNSGVTNRFTTPITVNADPVIALSGNSGIGADATDHLGTYGGAIAGGPTDSNTNLLLNFDRGGGTDFEDSSNTGGNGHKVTASGGAVIKASPFGDGKSAMFFDGSDDKLEIAASEDWNFSTVDSGDWTIEFWYNGTSVGDYHRPFSLGTASTSAPIQMYFATAKLTFAVSDDTSFSATGSGAFPTSSTNTWYHIAVVKIGTITTGYMDGMEVFSESNASGGTLEIYDYNGTDKLYLGSYLTTGSNFFSGYMDEIRIVQGVGVYTGNFTVPTSRLATTQSAGTNIAAITGTDTKLLIHSNRTD